MKTSIARSTSKTSKARSAALAAAVAVGVLSVANAASASSVDLGQAGTFTILGLQGGNVTINSSTYINGDVGYGKNVTSIQNQKIDNFNGTAYVHSTANFSYTAATYQPTGGILMGLAVDQKLEQANADALARSASFAAMAPTLTLGVLGDNDSRVVMSTGAVNVISLTSLNYNSDTIEFKSRPGFNDTFILNVTGSFDFSQSTVLLTSGTTADSVVWNFMNASQINLNKSANTFAGTILAPIGSVDYHNPAIFNGRIIALNINLHSDFTIDGTPTTPVPLPPAALAAAPLLAGLVWKKRRAAKA